MERSTILSRTAAAVAAAAIYEAFPGCELLGGGETSTGFFYQFFNSTPLPPEALPMLEERMRQIIREDRPIREMEMVSFSAKELFIKMDHLAAVDVLEELEPKELVSLVKIGPFCDLMDGPFGGSVRDVGAFKILTIQSFGDSEYRVEGCAFATKEQLKDFLRKYARYSDENHLVLGQELGLWERLGERLLWKERGLFLKRSILSFLSKELFSSCEVAFAEESTLRKLAVSKIRKGVPFSVWTVEKKTADPEGDEGLFEEHCQSNAQQIIYCEERDLSDLAISLLQTIGKTLIILGFHAELCLAGRRQGEKGLKFLEHALFAALPANSLKIPFEADEEAVSKIQWIVRDGLGRPQIALELRLENAAEEKGTAVLRVKAGVERILSLLLELNVGNLPSWLIPEHIRVLVLGDQNRVYGSELCAAIEKKGYRVVADQRLVSLKEKLFDAMKEKVPFVAVVGDRELQTNTVALRDTRSDRTEALSQEQLIERMNRIFKLENK